MALDPYDRRSWRGVTANLRTIEMLEITELRALMDLAPLRIPQGSYTGAVGASGGTHDGGGALDISVKDMTTTERDRVVHELRETSFAAWYRPYRANVWPAHIHAIAIGDKELSDEAKQQVVWYKEGKLGLWPNGGGPDNGPEVPIHVYRQDIDMSYYGPAGKNGVGGWDNADFNELIAKLLAEQVGEYTRSDTGEKINPTVGQALRAAHWVRVLLTDQGLREQVAPQLFRADNIFRNVNQPETLPDGTPNPAAYASLAWFIGDLENTQDTDHALILSIAEKLGIPVP